MKRIPLISLVLFLASLSGLRADDSSQAAWSLGTFNFDFARLGADEASQISVVESIGYTGLAMNIGNEKNLGILKRYQEAIGDAPFKVYAGFLVVDLAGDLIAQNAHIDNAIPILKKSDAKLWVIVLAKDGKKVEREQIVEFLRSAAERTKAAGVELVIYPHGPGGNPRNNILIQTAEEAIPYVEETGSDNLFISLHLCHEIRGGNGDRLNEVAAKIKPWRRLPSISGADIDAVNERKGWARVIQPLTMGDYDASKLLKALKSVDYKGPVILHTFGLQKAAANHHHTSFKKYQEMVDAL